MYLMYVDESGDPGYHPYASKHYILTGIIIDKNDWYKFLNRLKTLRAYMKQNYGLNLRDEFHSAEIFRPNKNENYKKIRKTTRIEMLKYYCSQVPLIFDSAKVLNICLNKEDFNDVQNFQTFAWSRFLSRYDTYLKKVAKDNGMIICDESNEKILRNLIRKNRIYNPVKSHFGGVYNAPTDSIIEDISHRNSSTSYLIQTCDLIAHILYRKEYPKGSLKKHNIERLFDLIEPVLLKEASSADPLGIVRN